METDLAAPAEVRANRIGNVECPESFLGRVPIQLVCRCSQSILPAWHGFNNRFSWYAWLVDAHERCLPLAASLKLYPCV